MREAEGGVQKLLDQDATIRTKKMGEEMFRVRKFTTEVRQRGKASKTRRKAEGKAGGTLKSQSGQAERRTAEGNAGGI